MAKINGAVHRTAPFIFGQVGVEELLQCGLLPAVSRVLIAVAHHGTHRGKSASCFGIDLSHFTHDIYSFLFIQIFTFHPI
jgi:hypothetical protein